MFHKFLKSKTYPNNYCRLQHLDLAFRLSFHIVDTLYSQSQSYIVHSLSSPVSKFLFLKFSSEMLLKFSNIYDVRDELGKGAFGTVMRCIKKTTGEEFAVKKIRTNLSKRDLEVTDEHLSFLLPTFFGRII